jgi:uncharacterized metal-binding protein
MDLFYDSQLCVFCDDCYGWLQLGFLVHRGFLDHQFVGHVLGLLLVMLEFRFASCEFENILIWNLWIITSDPIHFACHRSRSINNKHALKQHILVTLLATSSATSDVHSIFKMHLAACQFT